VPLAAPLRVMERALVILKGEIIMLSVPFAPEITGLNISNAKRFADEDNRAMDEEMNNFNRSINLSDELGLWFRNEFGFTSCYDIWRYDFSRTRDAESFIAGQCMKQCSGIGEKVARKVNSMV
ncbi:MAG: hypothetical protein H6Q24_1405, partial [Bacteroidetes bacterium]|nr:hypothetical protein [Bacteroidota bacterium]